MSFKNSYTCYQFNNNYYAPTKCIKSLYYVKKFIFCINKSLQYGMVSAEVQKGKMNNAWRGERENSIK